MTKNTTRMAIVAMVLVFTLSGCNVATDILLGPTATAGNAQAAATTAPASTVEQTTPAATTSTPKASPSPSPTATPTASPTPSPTPTATATALESATPTATATAIESATPAATASASESATATAAPTELASAATSVAATPTPSATATPSPSPTTPLGDRPDVHVVQYYHNQLPDGLKLNLKYNKYETPYDYFVVLKGNTVRELPTAKAKALLKVAYGRRLKLLAQVKGSDGKSTWYRVQLSATAVGYLPASAGSPRTFQFQQALERAQTMKAEADSGKTLFVNNYKNNKGLPPKQPNGKSVDALGYRRDQAAPAYLNADGTGPMRYLPDGTMLQLVLEVGDYAMVKLVYTGETLYVPKKYVNQKSDHISVLTQVVSVDRKNQNIIVLEYADGGWQIVSMCFVSTGKTGGSSLPTPLGAYVTLGKAPRFYYYGDSVGPTKMFAGFAPYAVRFSCGAWLHGVPHDVTPQADWTKIPIPSTYHESISSLGTTPQSHMCVRNYTSHAQFLYNWLKIGSSAVAVIE